MNNKVQNLFLWSIFSLIVVGSATVEDWYGRFDYSAEAPGYLDAYKAIDRGDWFVALTPQWSIGYALILSATRWMFPAGPESEWTAIHVANLVVFVATYLSFLYFLKVASTYTARVNGAESAAPEAGWNGYIFTIGTTIFLLWQLLIGNISRVSPDLSISCDFFLVTATCLNFFLRPSAKTAVLLGFLLGLGYILKVGFLPPSFLTLLIVWFHGWIRSPADRLAMTSKLAWALPAMALLAIPYCAALSKAYGSFTVGESGNINYAWSVNHLPSLCNWQGGPAPFGTPIHPTTLALKNPPVFTFAEPFPVTYPPYYNIPYYYEGYHHFFSIRNELSAIKNNLGDFRRFFFWRGHAAARSVAAAILVLVALVLLKERRVWWGRLTALWPLHLLAFAPIGIYLLIHIEPRYVVGPVIALLVIPFLPVFLPTALISDRAASGLTIFLVILCACLTVNNKPEVLHRLYTQQTVFDDGAWKAGLYLHQMGIQPGDKVAAVGTGSCLWVTWAYVSGAQIVSELGNSAYDLDHQDADLQLFTDNPDVQQAVFKVFRQAGAVVAVARNLDAPPHGPGWEQVPDTRFWIHRL